MGGDRLYANAQYSDLCVVNFRGRKQNDVAGTRALAVSRVNVYQPHTQ